MNAKKRKKLIPYLFIAPWIIGFIVFTIGPLIFSLIMSFFDWPVIGDPTFVGLGNYIEMFTQDKQVFKSLFISIKYAAIFVPLNLCIALFFGNADQSAGKRRKDIQNDFLSANCYFRCRNLHYLGMDPEQ